MNFAKVKKNKIRRGCLEKGSRFYLAINSMN